MSPDRTRFCWSCWRALRLCPPCCISVCRATPNLEGPRGADSQSDCGAGWYPASQSHNAHHFGQIEIVTVYYRWHPLYGQSLRVQGRKRFPDGEVVFVQLGSGGASALPAWMLHAACAAFDLGPPLVATGALLQLRELLNALPSRPQCDKPSLKRPPKEGRHEASAEVSTRPTQPSPAGPHPPGAPARQEPATDSSPDGVAAPRRQRTRRGERSQP